MRLTMRHTIKQIKLPITQFIICITIAYFMVSSPFAMSPCPFNQSTSSMSSLSWQTMTQTNQTLHAIWGINNTQIFACGIHGMIYYYNGQTWESQNSGTIEWLYDIWGISSSSIYAVGSKGTILHFNGVQWNPMISNTQQDLYAIWGASDQAIFAVGKSGTILFFDGNQWHQSQSPVQYNLNDIIGFSEQKVFAVGDNATWLSFDGNQWKTTILPVNTSLNTIWGASEDTLYAAGKDGVILIYKNQEFSIMTTPTNNNLISIWGMNDSHMFAVGAFGTILFYNGASWSVMSCDTENSLYGIWGHSSYSLFSVGFDGIILQFLPNLTVTIPDQFIENQGILLNAGMVSIPEIAESDIAITLKSNDTSELSIPTSISIPIGQTMTQFDLTVKDDIQRDGTKRVQVTATANQYRSGFSDIQIHDSESASITLTIQKTSAKEGSGLLKKAGQVILDHVAEDTIQIDLTTSSSIDLCVPESITIPKGLTQTQFDIFIIDDNLADGSQHVTITASVFGWNSQSAWVEVLDNDSQTMTFNIPPYIFYDDQTQLTAQLTLSAIPITNLSISLDSSAPSALILPNTLTVPSGYSQVNFFISCVTQPISTGHQSISLTASTNEWQSAASKTIIVDTAPVFHAITHQLTQNHFMAVWGNADNDIYIAGENGSMIHYNGNTWTLLNSNSSNTLNAIWGTSSRMYAVGDNSTFLSKTDNTWLPIDQLTAKTLHTVWGNDTAVWGATSNGTIVTYKNSWTIHKMSNGPLYDLWGNDGSGFFAVGQDGTMLYSLHADQWTTLSTPTSNDLHGIWGTDSTHIYATGANGTLIHWDGSTWVTISTPTTDTFLDIWGDASDLWFGVSSLGGILYGNHDTWRYIPSVSQHSLNAIWGFSIQHVYAVGNHGMILYYTPSLHVLTPSYMKEQYSPQQEKGLIWMDYPKTSTTRVQLSVDPSDQIQIPTWIDIPKGQTWTTFTITALDDVYRDGAQKVTITASNPELYTGTYTLLIHDNEKTELNISSADVTQEGNGVMQGTISVNRDIYNDITVWLQTSHSNEIQIPETVTIPFGQRSASFNYTIVDDDWLDGTQTTIITASVPDWTSGTAAVHVQDNDYRNIILILPDTILESTTQIATIQLSARSQDPITISLVSSDINYIIPQNQVIVMAGQKSAAFTLTAKDNSYLHDPKSIQITGTALNWSSGSDSITILDNDRAELPGSEHNALIDLYQSTLGENWLEQKNWLKDYGTECTWLGVYCDTERYHIQTINLSDNNLDGVLPSTLADLSNVHSLIFPWNQLKGNLPESLTQMTTLTQFDIAGNLFSGPLPAWFGQWPLLTYLSVSANQFSGSLPESLGNLSQLIQLDLSQNEFSGALPDWLTNLTKLTVLNLFDNQFSGVLPTTMNQWTQLQRLDLHHNWLTGQLDSSIGELTALMILDVSQNNLSGNLPDTIGQLIYLRRFIIANNAFIGSIPSSIGQCSDMRRLDCHFNQLTGQLPSEIGNLIYLELLDFHGNGLTGDIPDTFLNLSHLQENTIDLRWNALYTSNADLKAFLDAKQIGGDWETTQTIAPSGFRADTPNESSVTLHWDPIVFSDLPGGYEIFWGFEDDASFYFKTRTKDKTVHSHKITDLTSDQHYSFKIRSVTFAHDNNPFPIWSEFSDSISLTTPCVMTAVPGSHGTISPAGIYTVYHGDDLTYHIIPDWGYHIDSVLIDGEPLATVVQDYTFTNIMDNHHIFATFDNDPPVILTTIDHQLTYEDSPVLNIAFKVYDRETPYDEMIYTGYSGDPDIAYYDQFVFEGQGQDRSFSIYPIEDANGVAKATIMVSDGMLSTSTSFMLTVIAINDQPIADPDTFIVYEDIVYNGLLRGSDIENSSLTYHIASMPEHGYLTMVDYRNGIIQYLTYPNYFGTDQFKFRTADNTHYSEPSTIQIIIISVNDPPVSDAGPHQTVAEKEIVVLDGSKSYDIDNDVIGYSWKQIKGPAVILSDPNAIKPSFVSPYAPSDGSSITLGFWLQVTDTDLLADSDVSYVRIDPHLPLILPTAQIGSPITPVTGEVPFVVNFIDASKGVVTEWYWDFGNGYGSNEQHPTYVYDSAGIYTISLTVSNPAGSRVDRKIAWITVTQPEEPPESQISGDERNALLEFYNATHGQTWLDNTRWPGIAGTECTWNGISCTADKSQIIALELPANQLDGIIPESIGALAYLQTLRLSENQLYGELPFALHLLTHLTELYLRENQFTGPIPDVICVLTNLKKLYLNHNQLTGSIPLQIQKLTQLEELALSYNQLSGEIMPGLGNLTQLVYLFLHQNQFTGPIPEELGNLSQLRRLWLSNNELTGTIPSTLFQLYRLEQLVLSNNNLSGKISKELANIQTLSMINLDHNTFSGIIPTELAQLSELVDLRLNHNELSGPIPPEFGDFNKIVYLDISNNQLSESIPVELNQLSLLETFLFSNNQITGSIPGLMGEMISLKQLNGSHNLLTGEIPSYLSNLKQLELLDFANNLLSGQISDSLTQLPSLTDLNLSFNQLGGELPDTISSLTQLKTLQIQGNMFFGKVPDSIVNLVNLTDAQSDFRWNALVDSGYAVNSLLAAKQIGEDWQSTQTIAPSNFIINETRSITSVFITWDPVSYRQDPGCYEILASFIPGGPYVLLHTTTSKSDKSYTQTGLTPKTKYYFVIRTVTYPHENNPNTVYSSMSEEVIVSIRDSSKPPSEPSGLMVLSEMNQSISLRWYTLDISENDIVYYYVYRSQTPDGIFVPINPTPLINNTFIDTLVYNDQTYYYKIRAMNGDGVYSESFSNIVSGTPGYYDVQVTPNVRITYPTQSVSYTITIAPINYEGYVNIDCSGLPSGSGDIRTQFYLGPDAIGTRARDIPTPMTLKLVLTPNNTKEGNYSFSLNVSDTTLKQTLSIPLSIQVIQDKTFGIQVFVDRSTRYKGDIIDITGQVIPNQATQDITLAVKNASNNIIETLNTETSNQGLFEYSWDTQWLAPSTYIIHAEYSLPMMTGITIVTDETEVVIGKQKSMITCAKGKVSSEGWQVFSVKGKLTPSRPNQTVLLRVISPSGISDYSSLQLDDASEFKKTATFFTQRGIYKFIAIWPGDEDSIGCESDILEIPVGAGDSRAIIIGGQFDSYQKGLQQHSIALCMDIYRSFRENDFPERDIYMMLPVETVDYNGDGVSDPINANSHATPSDVLWAINNVYIHELTNQHILYVYMNGPPIQNKQFKVTGDDPYLDIHALHNAFSTLQDTTGCIIFYILEAGASGNVIPILSDLDRIIITSSDHREYLVERTGRLSFTQILRSEMNMGMSLKEAFYKTSDIMKNIGLPTPQLDDNGDDTPNTETDGELAQLIYFQTKQGVEPLPLEGDAALENATSVFVSAQIPNNSFFSSDSLSILTFYMNPDTTLIGMQEIIDIPYIELTDPYVTGQYEAEITCLIKPGAYRLIGIAETMIHNITPPSVITVNTGSTTNLENITCEGMPDVIDILRIQCDSGIGQYATDSYAHWFATPMTAGTDSHLRAIWGTSSHNIYSVGDNGTILHFNGEKWQSIESGTTRRLWDIWGEANQHVYIVGDYGTILQSTSVCNESTLCQWRPIESRTLLSLRSIWGTSETDIFAAGASGGVLVYDGVEWQRMVTESNIMINAIQGMNSTNIFAAGDGGKMLQYDGISWYDVPTCSTQRLNTLWSCSGSIFAVGYDGSILYNKGQGWATISTCQFKQWNDLFYSPDHTIIAVGFNGSISSYSQTPSALHYPQITSIQDIVTYEGVSLSPIAITITDHDSTYEALTIQMDTSNEALIKKTDIFIQNFGMQRYVTLTLQPEQSGKSQVTITVTDKDQLSNSVSFLVTVLSSSIQGDLNNDYLITLQDAILSLEWLSGMLMPNQTIKGLFETKLSLKDAIFIMQYIGKHQ